MIQMITRCKWCMCIFIYVYVYHICTLIMYMHIYIHISTHIHICVERVWMRMEISTLQEIYLTGFNYIFIWNMCISDRDAIETSQIHLLQCEEILSNSYLFLHLKTVLTYTYRYNHTYKYSYTYTNT